jgi:hypothetical protein
MGEWKMVSSWYCCMIEMVINLYLISSAMISPYTSKKMRTSGLLVLILLSTWTNVSGQTGNYELNQIGILGVGNHYAIDGGMGHLNLKVFRVRIRNNRVKLNGQLTANHPMALYTIFIAENNYEQRKLFIADTILSVSNHEGLSKRQVNGMFRINVTLKNNQNIYFEEVGYGMIEFRIKD